MAKMNLSANGARLIKGFEQLSLTAYLCPAKRWTIGWGSTFYANGKPVKKGDKLVNRECADDLFEVTAKGFVANVNAAVKVPLTQNQFDALVSFDFNTGGLKGSTLLKLLNGGDYTGAAAQFARWNKITGDDGKEVSPGLTIRRAKEAKLFLQA